ncbi:AraC family transcriptional regulator [Hahella sp. CCB-MM4]|uniref:AraC family transcriptional regulator n=1 Tax=Hahella sp. (strain CCB-MM4) TaxID=1926491 RepID=UPI000B9B3576|nr:AraC family transcriptional regulator [Hahella sp. CCB-MM4]OZG75104.1 AraC family transcriptional regulator [Hahella sp. CCB-MM4]
MTASQTYFKRFHRVLDYIDQHLNDELSLEHLCGLAAFSKYHFQRQFSELYGIGVSRYIQLKRLKRASYQLAFRDHLMVTDIAMDCGYENSESFSRAFKKAIGQTPTEFRNQPDWSPWNQMNLLTDLGSVKMDTSIANNKIDIVDFPETRIAVLEHRGSPRLLGDSIRTFIQWRKQQGLSPRVSDTFNLVYDDVDVVPAEEYRFDLCASIMAPVTENEFGIVEKVIPAGRCARVRHIGPDSSLGEKVHYLYTVWLPQSGEDLRDFPLFFQRVSFFPDVPEHEMITDLFLPVN